jgi:hypothetical protein
MQLVKELVTWISINHLNGDIGHIFADLPENPSNKKPPVINSFIPDVFVPDSAGVSLIIGEAKTARDLENKHTKSQLEAFLHRCSLSNNGILVMAVPWDLVRSAKSILERLRIQTGTHNVKIIVLEKLYG